MGGPDSGHGRESGLTMSARDYPSLPAVHPHLKTAYFTRPGSLRTPSAVRFGIKVHLVVQVAPASRRIAPSSSFVVVLPLLTVILSRGS
jgi:hypothetical protein